MPLTIPYFEPQLDPNNSQFQPPTALVTPAQNASFNRGQIVVQSTTGSIVLPPGNGTAALAGIAGPATSAITIANHTSSGAPAQTYWIQCTYTDGGTGESQPSAEIIYNSPAGTVPAITVASAGAPAAATDFNTYVGLYPGNEVQQTTGTALGSAVNLAYPLTNNRGANAGATNLSGNILGLAINESTKVFGPYPGGSYINPQYAFGATSDMSALAPSELYQCYVVPLSGGIIVEMSLKQTSVYANSLVGTQVGLVLDAASSTFIVDPAQSNKVATIWGLAQGVPPVLISSATASSGTAQGAGPTGSPGDFGGRVLVQFLSTAVLL